jgi:hypothetical protein
MDEMEYQATTHWRLGEVRRWAETDRLARRARGGRRPGRSGLLARLRGWWAPAPADPVDAAACRWLASRFLTGPTAGDHAPVPASLEAALEDHGLEEPALRALARVVTAARTARWPLAPEAAGLGALVQGFRALGATGEAARAAELRLYDALYAYCRARAGGL